MYLFCGQIKQLYGLSSNQIRDILIKKLETSDLAKEEFNENEVNTWGISIEKLVEQLKQAGLGEVSIVLEYYIPGNLLRLDAVLVGYNHQSQLHVMVVELKEWGYIKDSPDAHHVDIGVKDQPIRQHPAAQLNHYITSLRCYHSELHQKSSIQLSSMSYLPNFTQKDRLFESPHTIYERKYKKSCFVKDEEKQLCSYLKNSYLNKPVAIKDLELFTEGIYSMSTASLAGISKALKGDRFVALLNEQKDIKIKAMQLINNAFQKEEKLVLVIRGEAGTGKTILGLELIREYIKNYPSSYFGTIPQTLRTIIDGVNKDYAREHELEEPAKFVPVNAILKNSGQIVVIDEAHRLTDVENTLRNLCTKFQIIILLQDDDQRIKITEQGTLLNITKVLGYSPPTLTLLTQQRAKDSGTFIENLNSFLEGAGPQEVDLKKFDLQILNSLDDIERLLKQKIANHCSGKWLAPFCWKWDGKVNDISIFDNGQKFEKAWNPTVATQYEWYKQKYANHLDQVGCIYTAQGLEYDYVGLIFWDDLYYDAKSDEWRVTLKDDYDNTFISEVASAFGGSFNKKDRVIYLDRQRYSIDEFLNKVDGAQVVLELIRNIYRVLLSRGKKGLYIWFKHKETEKYFRKHFGLLEKEMGCSDE